MISSIIEGQNFRFPTHLEVGRDDFFYHRWTKFQISYTSLELGRTIIIYFIAGASAVRPILNYSMTQGVWFPITEYIESSSCVCSSRLQFHYECPGRRYKRRFSSAATEYLIWKFKHKSFVTCLQTTKLLIYASLSLTLRIGYMRYLHWVLRIQIIWILNRWDPDCFRTPKHNLFFLLIMAIGLGELIELAAYKFFLAFASPIFDWSWRENRVLT